MKIRKRILTVVLVFLSLFIILTICGEYFGGSYVSSPDLMDDIKEFYKNDQACVGYSTGFSYDLGRPPHASIGRDCHGFLIDNIFTN